MFLHLHKKHLSDFCKLFHYLIHQLWCFHSSQAISIPPALLIILFHVFTLVSHGVWWPCLMRVTDLQVCTYRQMQFSPEDTTALRTWNRGQNWKSKSILKRHLLIVYLHTHKKKKSMVNNNDTSPSDQNHRCFSNTHKQWAYAGPLDETGQTSLRLHYLTQDWAFFFFFSLTTDSAVSIKRTVEHHCWACLFFPCCTPWQQINFVLCCKSFSLLAQNYSPRIL